MVAGTAYRRLSGVTGAESSSEMLVSLKTVYLQR